MSIGAFIDKERQPSEAEIQQVMGAKLTDWQELVLFIREHYPSDEDFKFLYGKKYGCLSVKSAEDVRDIQQLLALRVEIKRLRY